MSENIEYGSREEFEEDEEMLDSEEEAKKASEAEIEAQKVVEFTKELSKIDAEITAERRRQTGLMFHQPTSRHSDKKRGVGITRKNKEESKTAKKLAKKQRKTNHKISSRKFRPTGSKKRK